MFSSDVDPFLTTKGQRFGYTYSPFQLLHKLATLIKYHTSYARVIFAGLKHTEELLQFLVDSEHITTYSVGVGRNGWLWRAPESSGPSRSP